MSKLYTTIFGSDLDKSFTLAQAIKILEARNLINVGEVAEQAISIGSGIELCSKNTPEIDLVSGKQIKRGLTNPDTQWHKGALHAFCSIRNHTSTILFVATERSTNKDYYFVFPYSAYKWHNGNTISVPFNLSGSPRRSNKWWAYEVKSFEKLCEAAQ
jgi:hypothetical protein